MGETQSCLACDSKRAGANREVRQAIPNTHISGRDDVKPASSARSVNGSRPTPSRSGFSECGSTDSSRLLEKTKVGIGAYFHRSKEDEEMLQVKSLLKGSPAQASGMIAIGDYITAVNGESVYGKSLAELAEKLLGPTGSSVECTFKKEATKEMVTVTLLRGINASASR